MSTDFNFGEADARKRRFIEQVILTASAAYDKAVERDAQSISGEINLVLVKETQGTLYGEPRVYTMRESGGDMYKTVNFVLREQKTINDFDWPLPELKV